MGKTLDRMLGLDPTGLPPVQDVRLKGFWSPIDIINRPWLAVGEAVGAATLGEEDPLKAAIRGLKGFRRYPEIGYQVFKEAQEEGFQPGDVGAFLVNVLADPLTYVGPGLVKVGGKALGKGAFKLGKYLAPETKAILNNLDPAIEWAIGKGSKAALAADDLEALGFKGPGEAIKHIYNAFPNQRMMLEATVFPTDLNDINKYTPDALDFLRGYLRQIDANFRPTPKTALQSLAQEFGRRILPVGYALRNFGGKSGMEIADRYSRAVTRAQIATQKNDEAIRFLEKFKPADRKRIVLLREGLERGVDQPELARAANDMGSALDDFGKYAAGTKDVYGDTLKVYDPITNTWDPLRNHLLPGYYPHRAPPEWFKPKKVSDLRKQLLTEHSEKEVERIMRNMGNAPVKVGHLEMARIGAMPYELDPLKVLPKYFHDANLRIELGREFGFDNQILDDLIDNLRKTGFDAAWANRLGDLITGKNIWHRGWEQMAGTMTSIQAISKLGFATSVANMSQLMNQFIRSGNLLESLRKGGFILPGGKVIGSTPHYSTIGAAAFQRALRDDIIRMGHGARSRVSDFYMKGIGFNWTERMGRHIGAVGGELEAAGLAADFTRLQGRNPKAAKRMLGELERRYGIKLDQKVDMYRGAQDIAREGASALTIGDELRMSGMLPEAVLETAGVKAANRTMHSFGPMDLPLGWRSPGWRMVMQFKSYIYKQMGFLWSDMAAPGLKYMATDGAEGTIAPMLRFAVGAPIGAELTAHLRDVAKSVPSHVWSGLTEGQGADWDYKEPFWQDPEPGVRLLQDLTYIGTFGILGDVLEAAARGRLLRYAVGPTLTDLTDYIEALSGEMDIGKQLTRQMPGAIGLPYSTNLFD